MEKLTDKKISSYLSSMTKDFTVVDVSGMNVSFRLGAKKNACHYYLRTKKHNNGKRIKIGSFPITPVAQAREEYLKMMNRLERGLPPKALEVETITLKDLYDEWYARKALSIQPQSLLIYKTLWTYYLQSFAILPIEHINVQWVDEHVYKRIDMGASQIMCLKCGSMLNAMMAYATAKGYVPSNPLNALSTIKPQHKTTHRASFEYETLREDMEELFAKALKEMEREEFGALSLLFLTLLRTSELFSLRLDGLKQENGYTYSIISTKTWEVFKIPFTPQAEQIISWFAAKPRLTDNILVKGSAAMQAQMLRGQMYDLGYKDKLTLHGIRSCGRQWMAQQDNIKESIAELCLAHTIGDDTERAYNRGTYIEQRLKAMRQWSDFVESCLPDGLTFKKLFDSELEKW